MKKDIEWVKKEIKELMTEESQNYPHEQMVEREVVLNLIDQLDEPEVLSQEWIDEHINENNWIDFLAVNENEIGELVEEVKKHES